MLDQCTNGQLQWEPLNNPYDVVVIGPPENRRIYPIYSGRDRFPQELKKCFPGEEKAIDEYMKLTKVRKLDYYAFSPLCSTNTSTSVGFIVYICATANLELRQFYW